MPDTAGNPGFTGLDMTLEMLCLARIFQKLRQGFLVQPWMNFKGWFELAWVECLLLANHCNKYLASIISFHPSKSPLG